MRYSFIMPFINRLEQFTATWGSLNRYYGDREDWEVIVVVDPKDESSIKDFKARNITYVDSDIDCLNPSRAFNLGVKHAKGKYLIITNPEVRHDSDVLNGLDVIFQANPDMYVVCSCKYQNRNAWLQHSIHNNRMLHFCSAISKDNYEKIGGFDEEYCKGVSYDDDDFLATVKNSKIPITVRDDLMTTHLDHDREYIGKDMSLVVKNMNYFKRKWR